MGKANRKRGVKSGCMSVFEWAGGAVRGQRLRGVDGCGGGKPLSKHSLLSQTQQIYEEANRHKSVREKEEG